MELCTVPCVENQKLEFGNFKEHNGKMKNNLKPSTVTIILQVVFILLLVKVALQKDVKYHNLMAFQ